MKNKKSKTNGKPDEVVDSVKKSIGRSSNNRKSRNKGSARSGETSAVSSSTNNAAWYAATPQLMKDSASLAYSYATGSPLPIPYTGFEYLARWQSPKSVPGILRMGTIPSIGISTSAVSPVNIASRKIYAWVRHANSGSVNYDAPDLMIYLLAMDSCYSLFSHCMRALGFVYTYSQRNRYLNQALIDNGMLVDCADLLENIPEYRYRLNVLASKLASLAVPNTMSYFVRHAAMYQSVYQDSPSDKAQLYIHVPERVYKFVPYEDVHGGMLESTAVADTNRKMSDILDILDDMISAIVVNEDMNIMSGDIIKAYGDNLIKIGTIGEDFMLAPVFDASMLTQIQNSTLVGIPSAALDITQATDGSLKFDPVFTNPGNKLFGGGTAYLTLPIDDVQPEHTMIATRLMNIPYVNPDVPSEFKLNHSGSEIVTSGRIISFGLNMSTSAYEIQQSERVTSFRTLNCDAVAPPVYAREVQIMLLLTQLQQFSMHPSIRLGLTDTTASSSGYYVSDFISLDNYTLVDDESLGRMHETALLSEFDVYGVGRA